MIYACLVLPFPPTTNNLFAGKARRFPSKAYKAWQTECRIALARQRPISVFSEPLELRYGLGAPDNRLRDCTNYVKAVEDELVKAGIIQGDDQRYVRKVTVEWAADVFNGVRVEILPYPAKATHDPTFRVEAASPLFAGRAA